MADLLYLQDIDGADPNDGCGYMQQMFSEPGSPSSNQYDFLPPLLRLEKHAFSANTFHRQLVGRLILETLPTVADSPEDVHAVMAIAFKIADDTDSPVRAELMEQVPHITMLCHENREQLHYVIEESLLPLVVKFLSDSDGQVRKMSQAALLVMMEQGLLDETSIEQVVCPVVLRLTELEQQVEYYTGAIVLIGKMAPLLGKAKTKELFVSRFAALCTDPIFYVRKACAGNIGELCAVLGTQATEELLLDAFLGLCHDEVWGVRKACAEVFLSVACTCSLHTRKYSLTPAFLELLTDPSRWVRMAAFCVLGPFISTFSEPAVTGLTYNHLRELVLTNPQGAEFRLCTSKGGDDLTVKYLEGNPPCNFNYKYGFEDDQGGDLDNTFSSKQSVSTYNNASVISNECDMLVAASIESNFSNTIDSLESNVVEEDKTGVGGSGGDSLTERTGENSQSSRVFSLRPDSLRVKLDATEVTQHATEEVDSKMEENSREDSLDVRGSTELSPEKDVLSSQIVDNSNTRNCIGDNSVQDRIAFNVECDNHLMQKSKSPFPPYKQEMLESGDMQVIEIMLQALANKTMCQELGESECKTHSRVENYNTFQYWRVPIPDISSEAIEESLGLSATTSSSLAPKSSGDASTNKEVESLSDIFSKCSTRSQLLHVTSSVGTCIHQTCTQAINTTVPDMTVHTNSVCGAMIEKGGKGKRRPINEQSVVPQGLLESFLSMTHPSLAQATDNEITHHCAFSFPAVAHTLGRSHWPLLKFAYEALASDMQWKVRRTVASSIHELAWILGEELAAKDLVPIFNGFIKDLDEVRIGALRHLSDFLKVLRAPERDSYLPRLSEFLLTDNEWNWRFRAALAEQLSYSVQLFTPSDARKFLAPLATNLLLDKVAAVRQMALALVCGLVCRSTSEPGLLRNLLAEVAEQFAHSKRWSRRQVFVLLCTRLVALDALPHEEFARNVLPHLLDLSWDPVANVRLTVARTLSSTIMHHRYFSSEDSPHSDLLQQVLKRLQNDPDRDVRFFAASSSHKKWVILPPPGEAPSQISH